MIHKTLVVLLLNDELLIALDVEMTLGDAGFDVTTVGSCEEAFEWLSVCRPDFVIVDIILRDAPCHAVIEQFFAHGVPFLVHSGDHPSLHVDTVLSKGLWIGKPFNDVEMMMAMQSLIAL